MRERIQRGTATPADLPPLPPAAPPTKEPWREGLFGQETAQFGKTGELGIGEITPAERPFWADEAEARGVTAEDMETAERMTGLKSVGVAYGVKEWLAGRDLPQNAPTGWFREQWREVKQGFRDAEKHAGVLDRQTREANATKSFTLRDQMGLLGEKPVPDIEARKLRHQPVPAPEKPPPVPELPLEATAEPVPDFAADVKKDLAERAEAKPKAAAAGAPVFDEVLADFGGDEDAARAHVIADTFAKHGAPAVEAARRQFGKDLEDLSLREALDLRTEKPTAAGATPPAKPAALPSQSRADAQRALAIFRQFQETGDEGLLDDLPPGALVDTTAEQATMSLDLAASLKTAGERRTFWNRLDEAAKLIDTGEATKEELAAEVAAYQAVWGQVDPIPETMLDRLGLSELAVEAPKAEAAAPPVAREPTAVEPLEAIADDLDLPVKAVEGAGESFEIAIGQGQSWTEAIEEGARRLIALAEPQGRVLSAEEARRAMTRYAGPEPTLAEAPAPPPKPAEKPAPARPAKVAPAAPPETPPPVPKAPLAAKPEAKAQAVFVRSEEGPFGGIDIYRVDAPGHPRHGEEISHENLPKDMERVGEPQEIEAEAVEPKRPPRPMPETAEGARLARWVRGLSGPQLTKAARVMGVHKRPDVKGAVKREGFARQHFRDVEKRLDAYHLDRELEEAGLVYAETPLLGWLPYKIPVYPGSEHGAEALEALEGRPHARRYFGVHKTKPKLTGPGAAGGIDELAELARDAPDSGFHGETVSDFLDAVIREADKVLVAESILTRSKTEKLRLLAEYLEVRHGAAEAEKAARLAGQWEGAALDVVEATEVLQDAMLRHLVREVPASQKAAEAKIREAVGKADAAEDELARAQVELASLRKASEGLEHRRQVRRQSKRAGKLRKALVRPGTEPGADFLWGEDAATKPQLARIHALAREKGWLRKTKRGWGVSSDYRRLAKAITGKRSAKHMTKAEASAFMSALEKLVIPKGRETAPLPTSGSLLPPEVVRKLPVLKEIGLLEEGRPAWAVFEKIGIAEEVFDAVFEAETVLGEETARFLEEMVHWQGLVGPGPEKDYSGRILFLALEDRLPAGMTLTPEQLRVAAWMRETFDKWADRLDLPASRRRKNYITHIFEAEIKEALDAQHAIPLEIQHAVDFATPKQAFNPYLKRRIGREAGLKEDAWTAIRAYVIKGLRQYHYEPMIQRLRVWMPFLPKNAGRYMRDYLKRLTGTPHPLDDKANATLKQLGGWMESIPGLSKIAPFLQRGNPAGQGAFLYGRMLYLSYLGFYPPSAVKNHFQKLLSVALCGPKSLAMAIGRRHWVETRVALGKSLVVRSRQTRFASLPAMHMQPGGMVAGKFGTFEDYAHWLFRRADLHNVRWAFQMGYWEARELGLSKEWAIKRGDEVARLTQYLYTKMGSAAFSQSGPGRVLGILTTWPVNFMEFFSRVVRGNPSRVYKAYQEETGQTVLPEDWAHRHAALLRYMAIVAIFALAGGVTGISWTAYTGWGSTETLARAAKGDLPGLELPGNLALLAANLAQGDLDDAKRYGRAALPHRQVSIVRRLEGIASGKKTWLDLFFARTRQKQEAEKRDKDPRDTAVWRLSGERLFSEKVAALVAELKKAGLTLAQARARLIALMQAKGITGAERRKRLWRLSNCWRAAGRHVGTVRNL
ncbi:MAG TPA: hypothetical protein VMW52_07830 [Phycisphaerae bacterium]|nr:hypothetical protein [Phycisphaerae bacterium]